MSGTIITVAQQKGGAGKTTLVAHLAVSLMQRGLSVALVDIDPQASLSYWYDARQESFGDEETGLTHSKISGWRTQREVEELAASHDVVLIDSAPHAEMETKTAIRAASLVVIPVQPSPMDFWATQPTLDLAKSEKVTPMLALNRVPPRAVLSEVIEGKLKKLDAKVAKARLGNRVGLAAAMLDGKTVSETQRSSVGAKEVKALAAEIYKAAGGAKRLK
ncbi:MAG: cobyrinic acid a,c-diamide synthase [Alphaproteobacteria bacterium]|nr:cobyrinic acid a,c-diamide synthase [Alphaproteobacteria bacterium]MAS46485.1 cobyrinic acid a,c-diamide synthase [Alphaproteobacteria bacterium]MAX94579.1 cobyrinic acid a,c-diamide synthase [Alphaproteobacteria bacterium]MBN54531.1 cobyrinic acid a,c-diamide synthase [Alphaproteobacteria bacterium]OUT41920.1 MAG: cobyrinic acid a,c-diamide synthase [Micavibrio sp. TMED2]|tara:strand:+ start:4117 stop:4773 length:657 start_codon:yes stop_codon:yes gene_type:complete